MEKSTKFQLLFVIFKCNTNEQQIQRKIRLHRWKANTSNSYSYAFNAISAVQIPATNLSEKQNQQRRRGKNVHKYHSWIAVNICWNCLILGHVCKLWMLFILALSISFIEVCSGSASGMVLALFDRSLNSMRTILKICMAYP